MTNKLNRLAAKLTTAAMVVSMVVTAMPASAEGATVVSDTLSRLAVSATAVDHTLAFTLGTAIASAGTLTFDYSGAGFTSLASPVCGGATTEAIVGDDLVITASASLSGAVSCTFTATNPGTVGSKLVDYVSSPANYVGSLAIAIVDSDQVTINAVVDPFLTFDLDASTSNTETAAPYVVDLGTLQDSFVARSGVLNNSNTPAYIWFDLATNATSGAVVTVKSQNGTDGLKSVSTPADKIESASETLTPGDTIAKTGYGLCSASYTNAAEGATLTEVAAFNLTCASFIVGGVTTSVQNIATASGPISTGRGQIEVMAAINALTKAHNDYQDVLTFVATATF